MEELVRYNYYKDGKDEGKIEGKIEGKLEGKTEGNVKIIKEILKDNVDIKLISKYTNKSEEEISKIGESITKD